MQKVKFNLKKKELLKNENRADNLNSYFQFQINDWTVYQSKKLKLKE